MQPTIKELSVTRTEFAQIDRHCPHLPYVELEVPAEAKEVLEVVFIFTSRDQGWASSNSLSYTWFEATTKRPDGRSNQPIMVIAPNRAANPNFFQNRIIFVSKSTRPQGPWVRGILARDVIQVIPKAAYPGWVNIMKEYQIKIKYTVDELPPLRTLMLSETNSRHYTERLDLDSQEIRLLVIEPGEFEDPIKGSFARVKLTDAKTSSLEYHALSYCWGDPSERVDIHMAQSKGVGSTSPSHATFSISRSAFTALRRLRDTDHSIKVWVDAICINQDDLVERSQQVRLMGIIYSSAIIVHIWLGEAQPGVKEAFQVIRDTYNFNHGSCPAGDGCQCFGTRHLLTSDQVDKAIDQNKQGPTVPVLRGMREIFRLTANTFEGDTVYFAGGPGRMELSKLMEQLFYNPWFTRVWVIQEALLASKAQVHFAGEMVPWEELVLMSEALEDPNFMVQHIQTRRVMAPIWTSMKRQGNQLEAPKREGILDVVLEGLDMKATDPRDRLFALLTFGEETHTAHKLDELVQPNYDKPVAQVFADFTKWWIKKHKSLSILSAVHSQHGRTWRRTVTRHQEAQVISRPSWAIRGDGSSRWSKANLDAQFEFSAAGGNVPDMALLSSSEPLVLRLRGKRLSHITVITQFPSVLMTPYKRGAESLKDMAAVYDRMIDACGFYGFWGSKSIQQTSEITAERAQNEYWTHINSHLHYSEEAVLKGSASSGSARALIGSTCFDEHRFETSDSKVGICPWRAEVGDDIFLLAGGNVPYLLRSVNGESDRHSYEFIGECFVDGIMTGDFESARGKELVVDLV